ncbi:MAG: FAD-binding oxidoreductase [Actinomycetota bacterium]
MSTIRAALARVANSLTTPGPGMPAADLLVAPRTAEELAAVLEQATISGLKVLIWGGGTHQGLGYPLAPDLIVSVANLNRIVAWEPEDLTLVAEPGVAVAELETLLASKGQTALLPEVPGHGTLGGTLAAGLSGYRRGRYGPTRDRILEVTLVTGDGRIVKAGGRVVKNVTGYDLPRLVVGSLGSLGVIVSACLKLWPTPEAVATVIVDDSDRAALVYRPLAVLASPTKTQIYLGGTPAEVDDQARHLGGERVDELVWPPPLPGPLHWSLRIPPAQGAEAIGRLPSACAYLHQVTVGEIAVATETIEGMAAVRSWAESVGGRLVLTAGTVDGFDRWGTPPQGLDLQRRLIAGFDPARVLNPGRLPGRI